MSEIFVISIYPLLMNLQLVLGNNWKYNEKMDSSYFVKSGEPFMTFKQAEAHCVSFGGHLASIHSAEENIYVTNLINKTVRGSIRSAWEEMILIGAHRIEKRRQYWEYTDGTKVDYANWAQWEPLNAGGHEDCVIILRSNSSYKGKYRYEWNDIDCTFEFHSHACKKPGRQVDEHNVEFQNEIFETSTSVTSSTDHQLTFIVIVGLIVVINVLLLVFLLRCCFYRKCSGNKYQGFRDFLTRSHRSSNNVNNTLTEDSSIYAEISDHPVYELSHYIPAMPAQSNAQIKKIINTFYKVETTSV